MPKPITHIAVIRLSAMGDVAMTVPVLRAFAAQHPNVRITMVSRGFFEPFFDEIPNVEFFAADLNGRHKGLAGLFRLYRDLKQRNIDAFADLHQVLRSKVVRFLFALSGFRVASIDKGRKEKKALTRIENKVFKPLRSTFERYADVFRHLGFPLDLAAAAFPPKANLSPDVLELTGQRLGKWIGIAPFAAHQAKQYPIDMMADVVARLSRESDYKIFLFGSGQAEIAMLDSLSSAAENVIVVAGKLKFREELHLIANLDVMLSMDSGNAHMASMYGVPTVTLWGATHPYAGFAPFAQPQSNAILSDRSQYPLLPTSIYGNKMVAGYENAMRTISAESVVGKIKSLLK